MAVERHGAFGKGCGGEMNKEGCSVMKLMVMMVLCMTVLAVRGAVGDTVRAAWTEEVISCEVGALLAGYNADDVSVTKADDLMLCACGVDDGENRVFIFSMDVLGIDAKNILPMRASAAEILGVPSANVLLTCTHNHHGPHTRLFNSKDKEGKAGVDEKYMAFLKDRIAAVARRLAGKDLWQEVKVGFHSAAVDENRNRRFTSPDNRASFNPILRRLYEVTDLIADKELGTVVFLDPKREDPLYVIGNYAAHTLASHSPGFGGYRITADFPGFYRRYIKAETGADAMFIQGACGDLVPKSDELGMDAARQTGVSLAKASIAGIIDVQRNERYQQRNVKVGGTISRFTSPTRRKWVKKLGCPDKLSLELQMVAIGDVAFVGVPGETVNELGLEIKWHSPFKRTFIAYCSTGYDGYISPANFVAAGGYEGRFQRFASRDSLTLVMTASDGLFSLRERIFPNSSVDGEPYPDCVELPLVSLPGNAQDE